MVLVFNALCVTICSYLFSTIQAVECGFISMYSGEIINVRNDNMILREQKNFCLTNTLLLLYLSTM